MKTKRENFSRGDGKTVEGVKNWKKKKTAIHLVLRDPQEHKVLGVQIQKISQ